MGEYEDFLRYVREHGAFKPDRTGTGTYSVFGYQMRFNLEEGFPLVTTKKIFIKGVVGELLWMLRGDTNIKWLNDNGIHIWDEWADDKGDLGWIYGKMWRDFPHLKNTIEAGDYRGIDQIADVIEQIKKNPDSRRHIVTAWHPEFVPTSTLPPCHMMFQFYVLDGKLSCQLYQRSADIFLGVPFNIASYALLTHLVAQQCDLEVGEFIWTGGDCHIYANHVTQVDEQLSRIPRRSPILRFTDESDDRENIWDYEIHDFEFLGYNPHPAIKAEVAV